MRLRTWLVALTAGAALAVAMPAAAQLPALRDRPLSAAERTRLTALESQLARVSQQRSLSVNAVRAIAQALGERLTTQDPDQLIRAIDERAQELGAARGRISALERDLEALDSMRLAQAVGPILTAANAAIEAGQLSQAEARLAEAAERFATARQGLQGRVDQLGAREADIYAQRAVVRASLSDHLGAAALYAQAAEVAPAGDAPARWRYRVRQAQATYQHGSDQGDPAALLRAAEIYRDEALPLAPREARPADWAKTQLALGNVLARRGQLQNDAASTEQALTALRAALEATPRSATADVTAAQAALAGALSQAGVRAGNRAQAEEGAAMYRAAAVGADPSDWQFSLTHANVLARLSAFGGDGSNLVEAAEILRVAAARIDRAADARGWADLQRTRATILSILSQMRSDPERGREAIAVSREAADAVDRAQSPVLWARVQSGLGTQLVNAAEQDPASSAANLPEAERRLRAAAEVFTLERSFNDWAPVQDALARGLRRQGLRDNDLGKLQQSAEVLRAMLPAVTRERTPLLWMETQSTLSDVITDIAERTSPPARAQRLTEARAAYQEVATAAASASHQSFIARSGQGLARIEALAAVASPVARP